MKAASRAWGLAIAAVAAASALMAAAAARAEDKLLNEVLEFNGVMLFMESRVPALVIGAVRNGQTAVFGFGDMADGSGKAPDGQTLMRIGSITKAFTGPVLAGLVARRT